MATRYTGHAFLMFHESCPETHILLISDKGTVTNDGSHLFHFDPNQFASTCGRIPIWNSTYCTPGKCHVVLMKTSPTSLWTCPVSVMRDLLNNNHGAVDFGGIKVEFNVMKKITDDFGTTFTCLHTVKFQTDDDDATFINALTSNAKLKLLETDATIDVHEILKERQALTALATANTFFECPPELQGLADTRGLKALNYTSVRYWRPKGNIEGTFKGIIKGHRGGGGDKSNNAEEDDADMDDDAHVDAHVDAHADDPMSDESTKDERGGPSQKPSQKPPSKKQPSKKQPSERKHTMGLRDLADMAETLQDSGVKRPRVDREDTPYPQMYNQMYTQTQTAGEPDRPPTRENTPSPAPTPAPPPRNPLPGDDQFRVIVAIGTRLSLLKNGISISNDKLCHAVNVVCDNAGVNTGHITKNTLRTGIRIHYKGSFQFSSTTVAEAQDILGKIVADRGYRFVYDMVDECVEHLQTVNLPSVVEALNGVSVEDINAMVFALAHLNRLMIFPAEQVVTLANCMYATTLDVAASNFHLIHMALADTDITLAKQWVQNMCVFNQANDTATASS